MCFLSAPKIYKKFMMKTKKVIKYLFCFTLKNLKSYYTKALLILRIYLIIGIQYRLSIQLKENIADR